MKIARRLFVVPLAPNHHGKTTMLKALLSQGGAPPRNNRLVKGNHSLVSPWGRPIDAYVFGRSYQETEKVKHGSILAALDSSDSRWRERELIILPSHPDVNDVKQIIEASHSAGFDAFCAALIFTDRGAEGRQAFPNIWEQRWDERGPCPTPLPRTGRRKFVPLDAICGHGFAER